MARPLWKGTLGFGLVSIPVAVVSAVRDLGPHFHSARGRNVVLTENDVESAAVERDRRIDGGVAYTLLREALRESGRIGIAKQPRSRSRKPWSRSRRRAA